MCTLMTPTHRSATRVLTCVEELPGSHGGLLAPRLQLLLPLEVTSQLDGRQVVQLVWPALLVLPGQAFK